jgi:hypothetical protein
MVNSEELIGTTEHLTLYTRCRINRRRYNRVRLYIYHGAHSMFFANEGHGSATLTSSKRGKVD